MKGALPATEGIETPLWPKTGNLYTFTQGHDLGELAQSDWLLHEVLL